MLRHREGVDLIPSNIELAAMEMAVFMAMSRERMMGAWLAPIKADYDYVIVDRAPTLGIIPINALAVADSVLIPVSAEYLPASGMTGLLKTVARVRRPINPGLSVEGILVTLYDSRNNLARDVERTVRGQYGKAYRVFETVVPRAVSAAEAAAAGESVFAYDPRWQGRRVVLPPRGGGAPWLGGGRQVHARERAPPQARHRARRPRGGSVHREGDDGGRGRHRHGRLQPAAREHPAERARLRVLHEARGDAARAGDAPRRDAGERLHPSHSLALKMKCFSQEGELGEALIRSIMEEEKPNQVESFRIPKRSIARFFRPSASREEVEARVVRALELLEQAERKRAAREKGGDPWAA